MKTKVFVVVFLVICYTHANAQKNNLTGDTIFVNTDEELQVKFPSDKLESRWTSVNPPYVITYSPNSIFLHAKADTAHCSTLSVFEGPGPRNHSFIVCYQKNISKVQYDYSTLKKLQQRIKEVEARQELKNAAGRETSGDVVGMTKMLEEGDKEQENGLFDQAELKYEKVLQAQAANAYALKQLSNVKAKKDKIVQLKSDANKALIDKQYTEALTGYNKVLELSPNDLFAQTQIEK